jgi:hypothetical protein
MNATTRTHTAAQAGPLTLDIELTAGMIRVTVEDRHRAEVTITTAQDTGPTAYAVRNATITDGAGHLTVRLPQHTDGGMTQTVHTSGRGVTVIQSGGTVYGTVVGAIVTGGTFYSGRDVTITSGNVSIGAPITIDVRLPLGSSLTAGTTSADVETFGVLASAEVRTVSGDIRIDSTGPADLRSTSGDIRVAFTGTTARAKTVSGDIRVHALTPDATVHARSVSGDIRVTGTNVDLNARTVSGRVTTR